MNTVIVIPFTDEVDSPYWQRKMELLTECETTNCIDLSPENSCEMLLRACRISCLDNKEMYFEPKEKWGNVIIGREGGSSAQQQLQQQQQQNSPPSTLFVSPKNETSAHAMAQTLLMPTNENENNTNNNEHPLTTVGIKKACFRTVKKYPNTDA